MADTSALYGLLGALGGAGFTGLAAFYGPLRLHRRQAEQEASGAHEKRKEAEVARLLRMRTTGRAWLDALERTVQDLQANRPPDVDRFDEIVSRIRGEATEAGYGLAHSGIWLGSAPPPPHIALSRTTTRQIEPLHTDDEEAATAQSYVLARLREATREVRDDVLRCSQQQGEVRVEVLLALQGVREAREQLNTALLNRIEEVNGGPVQRL
ncbi:hypothetical protein ACFWDI_08305 [Streptomyces sp. NPDC060064]|uniref:hypothetical protein n=1 Tax=Streptomyces sp. NPDC060064 TaxID=3347049 RepID=UPI0036A6E441